MKTFIYIIIIFLFNSISFSQVSNFDSSYVVVSSSQYDFKNPKTENKYYFGIGFFSFQCSGVGTHKLFSLNYEK